MVCEAAPISLFPVPDATDALTVTLSEDQGTPSRGDLDPKLPKMPDAGFFGRDETILALDRAFDTQQIVLLHAYAGSGKTATAAEFARWYALTGGVQGTVLFTSFEQYRPLSRVIDRIGDTFGGALEQTAVHWLALDDEERRNVALQVLKQIPVLWIWDNVEPVTGFPIGTESTWNKEEQQELVDFLRDCKETNAKFLLTSRRDERTWLGDLPARITIPPMPIPERVQLARAIAEKHGRRLTDATDWLPLLKFTQGNPLTITAVVGQALRDGLRSKEQIEAFVERLRAGEAAFDDEVSEGRSKSLGASLNYGFDHAFSEEEQRQLALLHLFQGFVNVGVLQVMGAPEADWCLPEVRGMTQEAGIALLDRSAEIGLLTAIGGGYYTIHPALPWFFKNLFDQYYSPAAVDGEEVRAARAFVEVMGKLGDYYNRQYYEGNHNVIAMLIAEEENLLHARQMARIHSWWNPVTSTMQGLRPLYNHTGRRAEWARLVDEIVPDFVDLATDGSLPGREEAWSLVAEYRVCLAREVRRWAEAERLQRALVDWDRQSAAADLAVLPKSVDGTQRDAIHNLVVSLGLLGEIQREQDKPDCVTAYEEAITLCRRIGDKHGEAICALNLGNAYNSTPTISDLAQAEQWYRRSLELYGERDRMGRAKCLSSLGRVAHARFREAREAKQPEEELLQHFSAALQFYLQALDMFPSNTVNDLAVTHNQLGNIYSDVGDLDRALSHYRESIRYKEAASNLYGAAQTQFNVAVALIAIAGHFADALEYAYAALRNFETYGEGAAEWIQRTQRLIAGSNETCRLKEAERMTTPIWFDDLPVLGRLPPTEAAAKLREIGENEAADAIKTAKDARDFQTFGLRQRLFPDRQWQHTAHAFGYLAPAQPTNEPLPIRHAGNIEADPTLANARIKITLDRLRIADYPGGATHRILFDFYAQNQVPGAPEHLHFNATYRVREGEGAAIIGYPIFIGLNVGSEGVVFKCRTVNVKNEDDEALLGFLESDVFKTGLMLATTAQPAIAPLSGMTVALTKSIAGRHKNVSVQDFYMGLDFTTIAFRARLAEGSYLAVQIPEALERVWDWEEWVYHPKSGQVVNRGDESQLIPYNHLVFSVSRYEGD